MTLLRFPTRTLLALAWVNVIVHAAALVMALVGMRPGSPLVPLEERLDYLAGAPTAWSLGWATWMGCTAALIAFVAALSIRLADAPLARLAVLLAVAGGTLDLLCDAIYITVLPRIAAARDPSPATFLAIEHIANVGGLVVANGMYSVGTLLLTRCIRRTLGPARWIVVTGYGTFGFGMVLVAAGFLDMPWLAEVATGPTIGLYCVWAVLAARALDQVEARA